MQYIFTFHAASFILSQKIAVTFTEHKTLKIGNESTNLRKVKSSCTFNLIIQSHILVNLCQEAVEQKYKQ